MSNLFYNALCRNEAQAKQLEDDVDKGLLPFVNYLNNSISAFKNKEVDAHWEPLNDRKYEVTLNTKIFKVIPENTIEIVDDNIGWYELQLDDEDEPFVPDLTDPLVIGKGPNRVNVSIAHYNLRKIGERFEVNLSGYEQTIEVFKNRAVWQGYTLTLVQCQNSLDEASNVQLNDIRVQHRVVNDKTIKIYHHFIPSRDKLTINGIEVSFCFKSQFFAESLPSNAIDLNDSWIIIGKNRPEVSNCITENVTKAWLNELSISNLSQHGNLLSNTHFEIGTEQGKRVITAKHKGAPQLKSVTYDAWNLEIELKEHKQDKWIQLIEPESNDDTGVSALDYFFSDNARILDRKGRGNDEYKVIKSDSEERRLLLGKKDKRNESVYPNDDVIKALADVSQLRKQQDAIRALKKAPTLGNFNLLSLFSDRERMVWPTITPKQVNEQSWKILTDTSFDGCLEQREFVCKALASEDFAILDGPPGTGKTTAILELIVQLVKQGKRVLLTASTHAAINNVLERIDSNNLQNLVFPLRIGDANNARGVEHYQFDNLKKDHSVDFECSEQLLVDSSNLVCGTTIGIMRLFNNENVTLPDVTPAFDVMIIDECSKTPFQEFLVPARYAAKHILVGDIRQLSPFTDREQIVANLEKLMLRPGYRKKPAISLSPATQEACFLIEELRDKHDKFTNQLILPVSKGVCESLNKEITKRWELGDKAVEQLLVISREPTDYMPLWQNNILFIEEKTFLQIQDKLPVDAIMLSPEWQDSHHAFVNNILFKDSQQWSARKSNYHSSKEIYSELMKRLKTTSWAEELCWRLERLYWLRLVSSFDAKTRNYKKTIERLLPKTEETEGRVFQLQNIAFPSVLEALSGDGLQKRKTDNLHTLNGGFNTSEKNARQVTLSYQHRMHPDISAFPGKQFYHGKSLKNGSKVSHNRMWEYTRYKRNGQCCHKIWVDVPKSLKNARVNKNKNHAEVEQVIKELSRFADWAEGSKNIDGEPFTVAILTFYKGQENALRSELQKLSGNNKGYSTFKLKDTNIKLATVDYFQGQEADLVILSMVNNERDGFLDSPNRLNVAITRARYQLVIVGDESYFANISRTDELRNLARSTYTVKGTEL